MVSMESNSVELPCPTGMEGDAGDAGQATGSPRESSNQVSILQHQFQRQQGESEQAGEEQRQDEAAKTEDQPKMLVSRNPSLDEHSVEAELNDGRASMNVDVDVDLDLDGDVQIVEQQVANSAQQHLLMHHHHLCQQHQQQLRPAQEHSAAAIDPLVARMRDIVEGPSRSQRVVGEAASTEAAAAAAAAATSVGPSRSVSLSQHQTQSSADSKAFLVSNNENSQSGNQKRSRQSRHCQLRHHHHHHHHHHHQQHQHHHQHRVSLNAISSASGVQQQVAAVEGQQKEPVSASSMNSNQQQVTVSSHSHHAAHHQHHHHHKCGAHRHATSSAGPRPANNSSGAGGKEINNGSTTGAPGTAQESCKSSSSSLSSPQQQQQQQQQQVAGIADSSAARNESVSLENKEQRCPQQHSCPGHHHHHAHAHAHHRHGHHRHAHHHHHHHHHHQQHQHKKRPPALSSGDTAEPSEFQPAGESGTGTENSRALKERQPLQEMQLADSSKRSSEQACCLAKHSEQSSAHPGASFACSRSGAPQSPGNQQQQQRANHHHHHHHHHAHQHRQHHHLSAHVHNQQQQVNSTSEELAARRHHNHHHQHRHQRHHQRKHKSTSSSAPLNQVDPVSGQQMGEQTAQAGEPLQQRVRGSLHSDQQLANNSGNNEQIVSMDMSPQAGQSAKLTSTVREPPEAQQVAAASVTQQASSPSEAPVEQIGQSSENKEASTGLITGLATTNDRQQHQLAAANNSKHYQFNQAINQAGQVQHLELNNLNNSSSPPVSNPDQQQQQQHRDQQQTSSEKVPTNSASLLIPQGSSSSSSQGTSNSQVTVNPTTSNECQPVTSIQVAPINQQQPPPASIESSQVQTCEPKQIIESVEVASDRRCRLCWCCCCPCSGLSNRNNPTSKGGEQSKSTTERSLTLNDKCQSMPNVSLEKIRSWGDSFDRLMKCPDGRRIFQDFLRCEYSEENILFWIACEELKDEKDPKIVATKARDIYEDYISILSAKEVSLDSRVRDVINNNIKKPTSNIFDEAQLQIYTLMHRDSYPRFINSPMYKKLAQIQTTSRKGSS